MRTDGKNDHGDNGGPEIDHGEEDRDLVIEEIGAEELKRRDASAGVAKP